MRDGETKRFPVVSPAAWQAKRDARRQLLDKVRARRRLLMERECRARDDRR